jgi:hypothetical protein
LSTAPDAQVEFVQEPGLDRHEWESEWASLEEGVRDDPAGSLPYLDDILRRMLEARGYDVDDPVAREGDDRDILAEFTAAHDVTRIAQSGQEPDPGDVGAAIAGYRSLFQYLLEERSAP